MDKEKDNGGPAPFVQTYNFSLRDWFAGMALQGLVAGRWHEEKVDTEIAEWAYKQADAMIEEQRK